MAALRAAWARASRSDKLVGAGGPVVGLVALAVGVASSDLATAIIGAVALGTGLMFAVPLVRGSDDR